MEVTSILRGDICLFDFGIQTDHTMSKRRPVVIIQNNMANKLSSHTIIASVRSNPRVGQLPVGVKLDSAATGLAHESYVDLGHIYTVDKCNLFKKIGVVSPAELQKIDAAIKVSLGLE